MTQCIIPLLFFSFFFHNKVRFKCILFLLCHYFSVILTRINWWLENLSLPSVGPIQDVLQCYRKLFGDRIIGRMQFQVLAREIPSHPQCANSQSQMFSLGSLRLTFLAGTGLKVLKTEHSHSLWPGPPGPNPPLHPTQFRASPTLPHQSLAGFVLFFKVENLRESAGGDTGSSTPLPSLLPCPSIHLQWLASPLPHPVPPGLSLCSAPSRVQPCAASTLVLFLLFPWCVLTQPLCTPRPRAPGLRVFTWLLSSQNSATCHKVLSKGSVNIVQYLYSYSTKVFQYYVTWVLFSYLHTAFRYLLWKEILNSLWCLSLRDSDLV